MVPKLYLSTWIVYSIFYSANIYSCASETAYSQIRRLCSECAVDTPGFILVRIPYVLYLNFSTIDGRYGLMFMKKYNLSQIEKKENNYAFIDAQNLNLGIRELGWKLNFKRFRVYLRDKYHVEKAFLFIGNLPENQSLYSYLQDVGYHLILKPVFKDSSGKAKGNVDADLVLHAMLEYKNYDQAVIVTSDGDFYSLVEHLYQTKKLKLVLAPNHMKCSILLRKKAREKIEFMNKLKEKLEYKKTAK